MNFDRTYRIGRCNRSDRHHGNRPAYAWPADSGLRLDDMVCPKCGGLLDRTSREAYGIREIPGDELTAMRDARITQVDHDLRVQRMNADVWRSDQAKATTDIDEYRFGLHAERADKAVRQYEQTLKRLRKAAAPVADSE